MTDKDALLRRARELGVETFYWDVEGVRHDANRSSIAKVVEILEADYAIARGRRVHPVIVGQPGAIHVGEGIDQVLLRLTDGTTLDLPVTDGHVTVSALGQDALPIGSHTLSLTGRDLDETSTIVVAPPAMPRLPELQGTTGLFAPAYALWERDSPLPGFGHLVALSRALPGLGVDVLVTLPLYAAFLDEPFDPSPYAPVSRQHWNEVYLDDSFFHAREAAAPMPEFGGLIDWRTLARRRRAQLLAVAASADAGLTRRVSEWVRSRPDVVAYARFRATERPDPTDAGHPTALVEASHHLAQYLAHEQLSVLESPGSAAFALDLPIGAHPDGFEQWRYPDLFAPEISVGAPPDELFTDGQDWGLPAQLPGAAERSGFALWRTLIGSIGQYSSLLRIDHVLGLHRLWWIPHGMSAGDGVYVRYPRHALTSVIAAEAARTNTTVVGENLGLVPQEIFDLLDEWSMLGLHSERLFIDPRRLAKEGGLQAVPADTVSCFRTHDMEPFAALYAQGDLDAYRDAVAAFLETPVPDSPGALLDASQQRLARSDAYLALADLDDLVGETTPHNVPGKVLPTIWRRRLDRPTSETLADPQVLAHLRTIAARSRS